MSNKGILNKLITEIKQVGLNAAFVSIEEDKTQNLLNYCKANSIKASLVDDAKWTSLKQNYYVGDETDPKNLQLFSLKF